MLLVRFKGLFHWRDPVLVRHTNTPNDHIKCDNKVVNATTFPGPVMSVWVNRELPSQSASNMESLGDYHVSLNERFNKQWSYQWFETPWRL